MQNFIKNREYITECLYNSTQQAALAAFEHVGLGNAMLADEAAVRAMRSSLNQSNLKAEIVIGEGERDKAPMLSIGEIIGNAECEPYIDIAVDPLEGTDLASKGKNGALSIIAASSKGGILNAPDVYMQKIAIGIKSDEKIVDLDFPLEQNLKNIALAKNCKINQLTAISLDRPRHEKIIEQMRNLGVTVTLIDDGDIAAIIDVSFGMADLYIGTGGAPEGVLAAAAIKVCGGQFCGKLLFENDNAKNEAEAKFRTKFANKYYANDLFSGEVILAATGITNGSLLKGVKIEDGRNITNSIVITSVDGIRYFTNHNTKKITE